MTAFVICEENWDTTIIAMRTSLESGMEYVNINYADTWNLEEVPVDLSWQPEYNRVVRMYQSKDCSEMCICIYQLTDPLAKE